MQTTFISLIFSCCLLALSQLALADDLTDPIMRGFPPEKVVTAKNWLQPPYHRWAFQHTEMIRPTSTVNRGLAAYLPLGAADAQFKKRYEAIKLSGGKPVSSYLKSNFVDGLLILKDGKVVVEEYRNYQTPDTRHVMFSVGKSYTGLIAETLVQTGRLDDTKLVKHYIPELTNSGYGDATVRQVMDMLVGLEFVEKYDDPYSDISQFIFAVGLGEAPEGIKVKSSLYEFLPTIEKKGEHGKKWQYVSATTEALGWIINRATNQTWTELFETMIYQKLHARRDAHIMVDAKGKEVVAGGMSMTLQDVGRFALMVANDGRVGTEQVVPESVVATIKAGGDRSKYRRPSQSYKSQWYRDHEYKLLAAYGIHGQSIQIGLENGVIIIMQSSWPDAGGSAYWKRRNEFVRAVSKALM